MSKNRENVIWPAKNGTWNIGFWDFYDTRSWDDDDYDSEWDVEYHNDAFWWASSGHLTPQAAMNAYTRQHANPGGSVTYRTRRGNKVEMERLDGILWAFQNPALHKAKVAKENQAALAKRNREGRKHARELLAVSGRGAYVKVSFITDALYVSQSITDSLGQDGDWLYILCDGKRTRVYNTKTGRLASNILDVEGAKRPTYRYRGW